MVKGDGYTKSRTPWGVRLKKMGRIAAILFLILIISGSLFTIISPFFGWRTEVVISGSMEPAIQTGSVVIVRPIVPDTIRTGDIIMFSSLDMRSLTTHRVVNVESEPGLQFITRGDANNNPDINPVYLISSWVSLHSRSRILVSSPSLSKHLLGSSCSY